VTVSTHGGARWARPDCTKPTKQVVRVTSWSHWRRGQFWVEIVLAVVVGVAAFVVAALVTSRCTIGVRPCGPGGLARS
jgi:hypothetical protein